MEDKKMNEKESLELISQMIRETRNRLEEGAGNIFLLWGYLTVFIALLIYFIWTSTHNPLIFWGWWAIPVIGWPLNTILRKQFPKRIITYIDRILRQIWFVTGFCAIIIPLTGMLVPIPILFIEALILSMSVMMTGLIIKYKVISFAGFISILLSFSLLFVQAETSMLIFAAMFVITMIVPGHMLNITGKKETNTYVQRT